MRLITSHTSPGSNNLNRLKENLDYAGNQMAELADVAGNNQWEKYIGGESHRTISAHSLLYIAALMALSRGELNRVMGKCENLVQTFNYHKER